MSLGHRQPHALFVDAALAHAAPAGNEGFDGGAGVGLPALAIRPGAGFETLLGALHDVFAQRLHERAQIADTLGESPQGCAQGAVTDFDNDHVRPPLNIDGQSLH